MLAVQGGVPATVAVAVEVEVDAVLVLVVVVVVVVVGVLAAGAPALAVVDEVLEPSPELPQAARRRTSSTRTSALFMFRCSSIA
jgi:hypothetical protein